MSPSLWLSLLAACVVISLTPGAGAINTISNSLSEGWRRAGWGIVGQQLALVAHVVIVAAGVGLIVSSSPLLFNAIRYVGAAYLVYLGVRLMLVKTDAEDAAGGAGAAGEGDAADAELDAAGAGGRAAVATGGAGVAGVAARADPLVKPKESAWSMVRRGFWVNLLNPKAIVFFLAFLPQFIRLDQPLLPQYAIFTVTCVVVDVLVMWGVFAAAARPFRRLTATPRGRRTLNTVFGVLFIAVAALLLFVH